MLPSSRPDLAAPLVVGRHVDEVLTVLSDAETAGVLSALNRRDLLTFLETHPLTRVEFSTRVSQAEFNADYDPPSKTIVVNADRPRESYGRTFDAGRPPTVSSLGRDRIDAMSRSLFHELGHHIESCSGPLVLDALIGAGRLGILFPITQRARFSPLEYFSECFAAYYFENDLFFHKDPAGYNVVEDVLRRLGLV